MSARKETIRSNEKLLLSLKEASQYSGIGINKLRELSDEMDCDFVLFIGNKRMIKRKQLEKYIDKMTYL